MRGKTKPKAHCRSDVIGRRSGRHPVPDGAVDLAGIKLPQNLLCVQHIKHGSVQSLMGKQHILWLALPAFIKEGYSVRTRQLEMKQKTKPARAFGCVTMGLRIFREHFPPKFDNVIEAQGRETLFFQRLHHARGVEIKDTVIDQILQSVTGLKGYWCAS